MRTKARRVQRQARETFMTYHRQLSIHQSCKHCGDSKLESLSVTSYSDRAIMYTMESRLQRVKASLNTRGRSSTLGRPIQPAVGVQGTPI
jgi:hypothetical protein